MSKNNEGNGKELPQRKEGEVVPFQKKVETFRTMLERSKAQIALAVPKHIRPDRLIRIAMTTIQQNPKLLDCDQLSVLKSMMQAAALGLEPDGVLGHAYLVPFYNSRKKGHDCQLIVGYKGLLKLARQSGQVSQIEAHAVRVGDDFKFAFGTDAFLKHKPLEPRIVEFTDDDGVVRRGPDADWAPGEITHFYAVCRLNDGSSQFDVMQTWEVDQIRDESQGYQSAMRFKDKRAPWVAHYVEMGKKTALRRLCKMIPSSTDKDNLQRAIAVDEAGDAGLPQDTGAIDVTALEQEQQNQLDAIADEAKKEKVEEAEKTEKPEPIKPSPPPNRQLREDQVPPAQPGGELSGTAKPALGTPTSRRPNP